MTLSDIKIKPLVWTDGSGIYRAQGFSGVYCISKRDTLGARFYPEYERGYYAKFTDETDIETIQQRCNSENEKIVRKHLAQIVEVEP